MANSQFFATKVHGFDPERWSGLGFPGDQFLRDAITKLANCPENLVVHIATQGAETDERERGLVLGIARLSDHPVATQALVEPTLWRQTLERYNGVRWPKALPYLEAWRFDEPPPESEILPRFRDRNLSRALGNTVLPLTNDEAEALLRLNARRARPYSYASLMAESQANSQRQILRSRKVLWPPPPPTFGTFVYERQDGEAHTYRAVLMGDAVSALQDQECCFSKIGWTHDLDARQSNLNFGMPDLRRLRWEMDWRFPHASRLEAERMERDILQQLSDHVAPHAGSQEVVTASETTLLAVWTIAMNRAVSGRR